MLISFLHFFGGLDITSSVLSIRYLLGHLVSIHGFLHVGLEPRPQEEFPYKQVLHHPLHVTEPAREGCGIVGKRLDETRLRGYIVAILTKSVQDMFLHIKDMTNDSNAVRILIYQVDIFKKNPLYNVYLHMSKYLISCNKKRRNATKPGFQRFNQVLI